MKEKIILIGMLILFFSAVSFAADECIACENVTDAPESNILIRMDEVDNLAEAIIYYENYSAEDPRIPITDSVVFVYVVPSIGDSELVRTYTDDDGHAPFDFSSYALAGAEDRITYVFRFIYCPFCYPEASGYPCGFEECMGFAGIETGYENPEDVPLVSGVEVPVELNEELYLPSSRSITYVPPPPEATGATTPAFCLPLVLVFALLGGALYYTGRNPFAAFNISTPRISRHIRYTPTGRGYSLNVRYVASSLKSVAKEGKDLQKARKEGKFGEAVKGSFGIVSGGKEAGKTVGKQLANIVTLGGFSNVANMVNTIRGGQVRRVSTQVAGKEGVTTEKEAYEVVPSAKEIVKGAKVKGRASYISMFQPGRIAEGAGKKAGRKAAGKIVGGAFLNLGIGLLGSGFATIFMSDKAVDRMAKYTDKMMATEGAEKLAKKDVEYENLMKLTGDKSAPASIPQITVQEGMKPDADGYYVSQTADGGTLKVDAKVLEETGEMVGTKTIEKEGKKVTYTFSQKANGAVTTDRISIQEGSGKEAVTTHYTVRNDGTLRTQEVTIGEGEAAKTYTLKPVPKTDITAVAEVKYDEFGERETTIVEAPKELENQVKSAFESAKPAKGESISMETLGLKGPGNVAQEVGKYAYSTVDVNMAGKEDPVTIQQKVGAEKGDYSYIETQKDGSRIEYHVDDGKIVSASRIDVSGAKTGLRTEANGAFEGTQIKRGSDTKVMEQYNNIVETKTNFLNACRDIDAYVSNQALALAYDAMELGKPVGAFTTEMEKGVDSIKVEGKKAIIEDETKQLLKYNAPALQMEGIEALPEYRGGTDPDTAAGRQNIEKHFENAAEGAYYQAGLSYAKKEFKKMTTPEQAGADALFSLGTDVADMNKKEAMGAVKAQLDARADLTPEQKDDALKAASKLWGKDVTKIANTYVAAAEQAAAAYPEYLKVQDKALEKLEPLYEGKDDMVREDVLNTAKTIGLSGSIPKGMAAELDLPGGMKADEALARGIIYQNSKTVEDHPEASLVKPPKDDSAAEKARYESEKLLLEMANNGLAKPPTEPVMPEPKPGETPSDYSSRLSKEYIPKLMDYEEHKTPEWDQYNNFYTSKKSETAFAASTVLLSAIKKGDAKELSAGVYQDAGDGIDGGKVDKWADAARGVETYVKAKEKKKKEKAKETIEELKEVSKKAGEFGM